MGKYKIREDGKNGVIEIQPTVIVRTFKKRIARDDKELIPMKAVSSASHNRRRIGADIVTLYTSGRTFEWKIAGSGKAKTMVREIMHYIS
jgi:predicted nuclease with RNAse H fold